MTAATELRQSGYHVLVIDKGRGPGGRLAFRPIGEATFDHGAQFMTARDPRFAALMNQWQKSGVVEAWYSRDEGRFGGQTRWRGRPTMSAPARHLARDLEVRQSTRMLELNCDNAGWAAKMDGGETVMARAVLLTPPVPQSLALLESGKVELPPELKSRLEGMAYERCLAVMAVLDSPSSVPPPGGLAPAEGPIAWIADNQMKGVSAAPAVTLHATGSFSLDHWDHDRQETGRTLLQAAAPWLGSNVIELQVHGWRYSKPVHVDESPCIVLSHSPPLVIAGDAFAGPRVEGAAISGWAAADTLKKLEMNTP
jgi:predicted NAD/FAD-dependent oxidoreductase